MKGRKIDYDFISSFIRDCVKDGLSGQDEICKKAQEEISIIDFKIKEVEDLKKRRAKLFDLLFSFDSVIKNDMSKDIALYLKLTKERKNG